MLRKSSGHLTPDMSYPANDPRVTSRFAETRSGPRIRVVECGPATGQQVLLLPGWGVSAFTYREQLPALGAAGYHAMAVDLKGHGFSDKPRRPAEYTLSAMQDHVADIIQALVRTEATVVAQSMAGRLAIELALSNNPRVERQILIGPVGLGDVAFARVSRVLTALPLDPVAPHLARRVLVKLVLSFVYGDRRRLTERVVDEYWAPAQFPEFPRAMRALGHQFPWAPVPAVRLARIRIPTLVIVGSRDRVVRGIARRAGAIRDATVVTIPDGGHAVNEECWAHVNAAILAFLARADANGRIGSVA